MRRASATIVAGASLLLVLALPLVGGLLAGGTLGQFTQFPPRLAIPRDYVHFSKLAAGTIAAVLSFLTAAWFTGGEWRPTAQNQVLEEQRRRFPAWGWVALIWTGAWWVLAWTRWE